MDITKARERVKADSLTSGYITHMNLQSMYPLSGGVVNLRLHTYKNLVSKFAHIQIINVNKTIMQKPLSINCVR